MPWNFRVLRHLSPPIGAVEQEPTFAIHEVYFDKGKEATPHSCATGSVTLSSDNVDGLRWMLEQMAKALDKPIIDYDSFQQPKGKRL
jgi:hypothetical protein